MKKMKCVAKSRGAISFDEKLKTQREKIFFFFVSLNRC